MSANAIFQSKHKKAKKKYSQLYYSMTTNIHAQKENKKKKFNEDESKKWQNLLSSCLNV